MTSYVSIIPDYANFPPQISNCKVAFYQLEIRLPMSKSSKLLLDNVNKLTADKRWTHFTSHVIVLSILIVIT